jgi:acid phosphatase family membrane protein YuiD
LKRIARFFAAKPQKMRNELPEKTICRTAARSVYRLTNLVYWRIVNVMSFAMVTRAGLMKAFFENPIFLSSVSSWFIAQLMKAVIVLLRGCKSGGREILKTIAWRTGGMPSSHASLVSAMATSVAFQEGISSNLFVVSFFFALIVMRDAMGVRRSTGIQARLLNSLGRQLAETGKIEYHPVKEVCGHSPLEVIIGAFLGIFIAAAYAYL